MYGKILEILSKIFSVMAVIIFFLVGLFYNREYNDENVMLFITFVACLFLFLSFICYKLRFKNVHILDEYGYPVGKEINKNEVPLFRDIPCNGDIYYANFLIKINDFDYNENNILGAIILKWVNEKKIVFWKEKDKFNRIVNVIDLRLKPIFEDEVENKLFSFMYEASSNGILEIEEFQEWFNNYNVRLFGLLAKKEQEIINSLKIDTHIYHRITYEECMYTYVLDDKIRDDSIQLYGLKKYLEEFSNMDSKEILELPLWEEYMMFAYLFGVTDKISKQLVDLYPDMEKNDEFDMIK